MAALTLSLLGLVTLGFEITAEDIAVACALILLLVAGVWVSRRSKKRNREDNSPSD